MSSLYYIFYCFYVTVIGLFLQLIKYTAVWHLSSTLRFCRLDKMPLSGADLGGGCRGCASPPPEMTCGFLIQLSAAPPKKNPRSAPVYSPKKRLYERDKLSGWLEVKG